MKTRVLMVYPKYPHTFWNYETLLPVIGKKAMYPPLGLLTIASLLPDNYDVKLVDMNAYDLAPDDLDEADLVFISAMGIQQESFQQVVNLCLDRKKTIVAGGPLVWSAHNIDVLNIDKIHHLFLGEAETVFPKFIEDYERGAAQRIYADEAKPDMSLSPPPRWDLIDITDYTTLSIQFSRGCPFQCEFCDVIEMNGKRVRTKTPEQFLNELELLYQKGYRGELFIVDDNFIGHIPKTKKLLTKLIAWQRAKGYPFMFFTQISINAAHDDELLDMMSESGFGLVFVGIESPDATTLINVNKLQNVKTDMIESIKKLQAKRMIVMGGFIIGFDTDTEEIFDIQIDFLQKAGIPIAMVGLLAAMPNTRLYRRLQSENRIIGDGWHTANNTDLCLNFIPRMPERNLIEGYRRVISEIYSPRKWFDRHLKMLEHYPKEPPPRAVKMFRDDATVWHKVKCIARDVAFILKQVFSSYGMEYVRFILKARKINKANYLMAVGFASMYPHYRAIAGEIVNTDYDANKARLRTQVSEDRRKAV